MSANSPPPREPVDLAGMSTTEWIVTQPDAKLLLSLLAETTDEAYDIACKVVANLRKERAALAAERGLEHLTMGSTIRGEGDGTLDLQAVRRAVIEECAKVVDDVLEEMKAENYTLTDYGCGSDTLTRAASRIRSLGEEGNTNE